jgi:hypothetical protein
MFRLRPEDGMDWVDNLLLEWMLAIFCFENRSGGWTHLKRIEPNILGVPSGKDGHDFESFFDHRPPGSPDKRGAIERLSNHPSFKTLDALRAFLKEGKLGMELPKGYEPTIRGTVQKIINYQGNLCWEEGVSHGADSPKSHWNVHIHCADQARKQVEDAIKDEESSSWKQLAKDRVYCEKQVKSMGIVGGFMVRRAGNGVGYGLTVNIGGKKVANLRIACQYDGQNQESDFFIKPEKQMQHDTLEDVLEYVVIGLLPTIARDAPTSDKNLPACRFYKENPLPGLANIELAG